VGLRHRSEKFFRGWFPQEPTLGSTRINTRKSAKQPPAVIPPQYHLSATKSAAGFAFFWAVFYGFLYFVMFHVEIRLSLLEVAAWATTGAIVGIFTSWVSTKSEFSKLSKEYHYEVNDRDLILTVLMFLPLIALGVLVNWFIYGFNAMFSPLLFLVYFWGVSLTITRALLFAEFEKIQNMRIVQSWWGMGIFLIPKPPCDRANQQRSETAT
jgi:hypothetical protein